MKTAAVVVTVLAAGPLLLAAPALLAASADAAACADPRAAGLDAGQVEAQVRAVLEGRGDGRVSVPGLDDPAEQVPNAEVIQATGAVVGVSARGQVVALATALQESRLRNITYGDRDSVGLFQQRPSQGWGTVEQILDPVYASRKFYSHLLQVPGWESMTIAQAAQAVQRSAFPEAYAKWEPLARALQQALARHGGEAAAASAPGCEMPDGSRFGPIPAGALPEGYEIPKGAPAAVHTAIRWGLGQLGTPYQWGGSCTNPHGPDPMGRCDCSSLMQQSYRAAGVRLTRTTYTQVREGRAVAVNAIEPGNLLFTRGTARAPEHVGMYIGSGLVLHAPATGDVVRVAPLDEWLAELVAVRRIV